MALVITIVIIIILTSVTLVATFGENGIIKKAELARDLVTNSTIKENENMNSLMDEYANIMSGGENIPEPPKDETPPIVSIVVGTKTENSIEVTANATDDSGIIASYKYYLNGAEQKADTANTYTFTGLTAGTEYEIKVEAFDKAGNKGENSTVVRTKIKLPEGVPIPEGFVYVGGTKNDGVVISDNSDDEGKGTSHTTAQNLKGNQFVWVPVSDLSTMFEEETVKLNDVETMTNVYSKLRIRNGDNYTSGKPGDISSSREPDVLSNYDTESQYYNILGYESTKEMADGIVQEYKEMYESVKKYKGFYIGRYELSGSVQMPTSKAGLVLTNPNWYKQKKACMEIIKGNEQVKSTMIYGNQWDQTMNWLVTSGAKTNEEVNKNSSSWGNHTGSRKITGSNEEWSANHIYDLVGNCSDWTQEASNTGIRIIRGRYLQHGRF